jgi:hypothetical protein
MQKARIILFVVLVGVAMILIFKSYSAARRVGNQVMLILPYSSTCYSQRLVFHKREKPTWHGIAWVICYETEMLSESPAFVIVSLGGNFIDTNLFYSRYN